MNLGENQADRLHTPSRKATPIDWPKGLSVSEMILPENFKFRIN